MKYINSFGEMSMNIFSFEKLIANFKRSMNFLNKLFLLLTLLLRYGISFSQTGPNLVVAIVVDQMKYEYVDRFWNDYSSNGFKKLVNNGVFCRNTHYNFIPTYTGPAMLVFLQEPPHQYMESLEIIGIIELIFHLFIVQEIGNLEPFAFAKSHMKSLILATGKCPLIYYFVIPLETN